MSTLTRGRSRARTGTVIAAALLLAAVAVRLLSPASSDALPEALSDFVTLTLSVIIESVPFVFLGILISIVVQLWVPERLLHRVLPRNPAARRLTISVLGILLPVCECGNVPLARGLMMRGLSVSESVTFLLAAPILNPVTIVTTYQVFGWEDGILLARILGALVIANLVGWLFSHAPQQEQLLTPGFRASCAAPHPHDHGRTPRMLEALSLFRSETTAIMPALFVGSAIAGLIQVAATRDLLVTLGSDPIWSVLALMALAFVVALCSNVDAFFILALGSTFMPGSIVAFLVFGPMIDVKMLALLRTTFTTRTLVTLTALVALSAAALGLGVNLVA
ncbi:permease [Naasia sp. SYSU D00057]|uniref:permease n=1 Tax=Naasia sp. SYSU D00057 TaxID=2817380 RepID=UPI001B31234B|nr:permease [Naasia sp. SYSU D00057]